MTKGSERVSKGIDQCVDGLRFNFCRRGSIFVSRNGKSDVFAHGYVKDADTGGYALCRGAADRRVLLLIIAAESGDVLRNYEGLAADKFVEKARELGLIDPVKNG